MLEKEFLEFGYTLEEYLLIRNGESLKKYTDSKLLEKFKEITKYFLSYGYTNLEIIKKI